MAHTRIIDQNARIISQCATGKFIRNVATASIMIANSRTGSTGPNHPMADFIMASGATLWKGLFVAPCDAKILGISVVGNPYPVTTVSGLIWLQVYQTNTTSGGDYAILTDNSSRGILVGAAATSGGGYGLDGMLRSTAAFIGISGTTTVDGTLDSTYALLEAGEAVYITASSNYCMVSGAAYTVSGLAVTSNAGRLTIGLEWIPIDRSYASSE
jgi:hypothetical protein